MIVNVILVKSTRAFDKEYSYKSDESIGEIEPGSLVLVPFGRGDKLVKAIVTDTFEERQYKGNMPLNKLKYVHSVDKEGKALSNEFLEMVRWMRNKYICSGADAVKLLLPPGGNQISEKTVRTVRLAISESELKILIESGSIKRIYQIRILEYLAEQGETEVTKVLASFSTTVSVLNTLSKKGYVDFSNAKVSEKSFGAGKTGSYPKPRKLTEEQEAILADLKDKLDSRCFAEYLLHGITGSGKTEIYLNLIQHVLEMGGDAIVLVPEIALTPQMTARFVGRFGEKVAILHSRLTVRERFDQWQLINKGKVNVVVGARSAIFAPFRNVRLIIIDEEHEQTYKSESTPKYLASEVARFRCRYNNCVMISGSATPSIETYHAAKNGKIGYLRLDKRATGGRLPEIELVDMRLELEEGNRSIFSYRLQEEIKNNLMRKQQTILLMNRRGYSSFLLCRECGYSPKCHNCNVSMTYHNTNERVICHYCGYTEKSSQVCPVCGSTAIKQFGCGTQKVENEIKKLFPEASVIRMDFDTTTGRNSHEEILRQFTEDKIDILVGTQMIAKGHDMHAVTLVGILAADSILNMDDFRASEKTFQLITQAAGRAGRGNLPGRVIIQGYNIEDYAIRAAAGQNYDEFYKNEIMIREQLNYPPFVIIASAVLSGEKDRQVYDSTVNLKNIFQSQLKNLFGPDPDGMAGIDILGPARCPVTKINNKYRWRLIIKSPVISRLVKLCGAVLDEYDRLYGKNNKNNAVSVSIDINPVNML